MGDRTAPWPIEELVRAQRMACDGKSVDDIATALGRPGEEVRRRLEPDAPPVRQELAQKFANVGYPHMKARR
jgi:hypothetical protein